MRIFPLALTTALAVIAFAFAGGGSPLPAPSSALAIEIEPVIWQLNKDYPSTIAPDASLPISNVYIKTHDGSDWMSEYDGHPSAISGPASIRALIDSYAAQGVEVSAWFVPKGTDFDRQVQMAVQVIDSGVKALYADLEPFTGFCYLDCRALSENFWYRVRQERPEAHLGVIYDPRPWWWNQSATAQWFSVADSALPMCYWESYSGQNPWGDPAGCVAQAHHDLKTLAPGRDLEYVPMLQGNSNAASFVQALDAAVVAGSERVSVWRRGVVSADIWDLVSTYQELDGPRCEDELADGCLAREATSSAVFLIEGGAPFNIPSSVVFEDMGLDWRRVQVVPTGFVGALPTAPADTTLVREHGASEIWVAYGGARFHVANPAQLMALGLTGTQARIIPPGALAQVPLVPEELVRVRELSTAQEYLVVGRGRLAIDEGVLAALLSAGAAGERRYVVPDGGLAQIPVTLLRRGDSDCSGTVAPLDAVQVLRFALGLPQPGFCAHLSGDSDCDGSAASLDALLVLRFVAGETPAQSEGCTPIGAEIPPPPVEEPTATVAPPDTPVLEVSPTPEATGETPTATSDATSPATESPTPIASPSPSEIATATPPPGSPIPASPTP